MTSQNDHSTSGPRADSLVAGLSLLLVLTIGQRFVGFGRNILFCRWLEPAELGRWNLAFNLLLLAAPLVVLGVPGSFGRYIEHYRQKGQLKSFLRRTTLLTVALALTGMLTIAMTNRTSAWLFFGDEQLTGLLLASVFCLASVITFNFMIELFTALRQLRVVSCMQIANSILFAIASLGLLHFWEQSALAIVLGYGAACLVTSIGASGALLRGWNSIEDSGPAPRQSTLWKKLLPYAWWIWFSDVILGLFSAADRYMIIHFYSHSKEQSAAMIGQYHSSLIIPALMLAVSHMVASVIMPYLSSDWEQGKVDEVRRHVNAALQLFGFAAYCGGIVVLLLSPLIFGWALQGKYTDGLFVLPWTLALTVWAGMMTLSMCYLRCAERAGSAVVGPVAGVIVNVGLNLILLPRMGLLGAVIATAVANLITYMIALKLCSLHGFRTERGTLWITALPLFIPMGLPIAATAAVVTLWAMVRTNWVCSHENKLTVLAQLEQRLPTRFAYVANSPIFSLTTPT